MLYEHYARKEVLQKTKKRKKKKNPAKANEFQSIKKNVVEKSFSSFFSLLFLYIHKVRVKVKASHYKHSIKARKKEERSENIKRQL